VNTPDQSYASNQSYAGYGHAPRRAPGAAPASAAHAPSQSGTPVVSFENVSKHYGSLRAVDGLTVELRYGETVALLGPNGAGKSTSLCPDW
jgi:ATPase subunit of ABC transporter with duplicated ATPase domains